MNDREPLRKVCFLGYDLNLDLNGGGGGRFVLRRVVALTSCSLHFLSESILISVPPTSGPHCQLVQLCPGAKVKS